ncbi:MAG: YidB family protein [Pyrinomonadaceae bacterium]
MFDSIVSESGEKYGLGDKAGNLLSSLLNLITDQNQGGFAGFLDRFRKIGLSDELNSWIGKGANTTISGEQVEWALGTDTTDEMAKQAGLDADVARASLGRMIPAVVSELTPNGTIPTDDDLLSRIGGYLSGVGESTISTTGVITNAAFDRIGTAAAENISEPNPLDDIAEFNDDSPMKWIVPLIILILFVISGWAFCGK